MIKENEEEKKKRVLEREAEKKRAVEMLEEFEKQEEIKEKKRADEWAAREAKIQEAMGRMADTVLKKSNAAEKELERRVMHYAEERDRKAAEEETKRKRAALKRDLEVKATLDK